MKTQEQILDNIVEIMDNHINNKEYPTVPSTAVELAIVLMKIQTLIEEEYIHGSLDNEYK